MRSYTDLCTTRFKDFDAEDMMANPCCRTGRPTVTKTVTETKVAICAKIAVNILFPFRDKSVNAGRIRKPVKVEIFPECRRSQIYHRTPIVADDVERTLPVTCTGHSLKHNISVESRESMTSIVGKDILVCFLGIRKTCESHQRRSLL